MKYTRIRPGRYNGTDGTNTATILKMREGMIYSHEWMWVTKVNGVHVTNADTLAAAKTAISEYLKGV